MTDVDTRLQTTENKANIVMLNNKLNALIAILKKEGITAIEEVDAMANDIMNKND